MTFKGLLKRLVFTGVLFFFIHAFSGEVVLSLFLASIPVFYYEMLRPR
jgi:hypothetical protein